MIADLVPLVYAANPRCTYGTRERPRALIRGAELVPHAQIMNPATRYTSNAEWHPD